jgi:acetoin utilization protein AcuC
MASEDDIQLFHSKSYIDFVKKSSIGGSGFLDKGDTPIFKGMFEASRYTVGSTLKALKMIMENKTSHAFNPIGGFHHAQKNAAAGFCIFNDVVIAIIYAKIKYNLNRILYLDIDAHHGDGVFYHFYDDPSVFIADIHEDGKSLYPGTGFKDEKGGKNAEGTKLSIPLPPLSGDDQFRKEFLEVESFVNKIKPELILFQSGGDCLRDDPLTHLQFTPKSHQFAAETLHKIAHTFCNGKILAMGGGGYNPQNTAKAWVEVVKAFIK